MSEDKMYSIYALCSLTKTKRYLPHSDNMDDGTNDTMQLDNIFHNMLGRGEAGLRVTARAFSPR